ncbi:MAG TPA: carboxypeptidase-like regulatory domain-containing protein [Candidatus Limnocylindrales bacterium]|jgi:hypothetical protein|nr:carboxypeptidase-like regulatory domain-containing protein [Candidatus Limnocylindrales bacterium]
MRFRSPAAVTAAFLLVFALGPQGAAAEQPDVSGTVADVTTQQPISGADVLLFMVEPGVGPSPFASTTTDANGYYQFAVVEDAHFVLAVKDGYEQRSVPSEPEQATWFQPPVEANIYLYPTVGTPPVFGTVVYGDTGLPVDSDWIARWITYEGEDYWDNAIGFVIGGEFAFWRVYPHRPFRIGFDAGEGYVPYLSDVLVWNDGSAPASKDECKKGGWQPYGFRNQGLCIQFLNTGKDSRAGTDQVVVHIVLEPAGQ